jgi:hypothetical protein
VKSTKEKSGIWCDIYTGAKQIRSREGAEISQLYRATGKAGRGDAGLLLKCFLGTKGQLRLRKVPEMCLNRFRYSGSMNHS